MRKLLKNAGLASSVVFVLLSVALLTPGCTKKPEQEQLEQSEVAEQQPVEPVETQPQPDESLPPLQVTPPASITEPEPVEPESAVSKTLYFKELDEIEQVEAERLLNVAMPGQKIGALPMTGYKLMVETCRQINQKWPDSIYAYKAKGLLADLPERDKQTYNITEQEVDVSMYEKPRTGTQPYTVKE